MGLYSGGLIQRPEFCVSEMGGLINAGGLIGGSLRYFIARRIILLFEYNALFNILRIPYRGKNPGKSDQFQKAVTKFSSD